MSIKKSESYTHERLENQRSPFEFIVIVEDNDTDLFIQETLINNIGLGNRIEMRKNSDDVLKDLFNAQKLTEIPDLIILSLPHENDAGLGFLDRFAKLPDLVRAKCKVVIVASANSRDVKQRAIMNPNVIRYLEKPIDLCHFRDFMFM